MSREGMHITKIMARKCIICGKEFFHSKLRKVTCSPQCMQKYVYHTHKDKRLLYVKEYYARNRDNKRAYREAHKDEIIAYAKAYREAHREQLRINARKYRIKKIKKNVSLSKTA